MVDEIADGFADEILWPVVNEVGDIVRDVFRVDDKEEAETSPAIACRAGPVSKRTCRHRHPVA